MFLLIFSPSSKQCTCMVTLPCFRADGRLALEKQDDSAAAEGFTVGLTEEEWGHGVARTM